MIYSFVYLYNYFLDHEETNLNLKKYNSDII